MVKISSTSLTANLVTLILIFTSTVNGEDATYEMLNTCYINDDNHLFVQPNSSISLVLTLLQRGLNCSVQFLSYSAKLEVEFLSINLPRDETGSCIARVGVSDFINGSALEACREDDLPVNRSVVVASPAVITVISNCPPETCNRFDSKYSFRLRIAEKFEDFELERATAVVENSTIFLDLSSGDDQNLLTTTIIVLGALIGSVLILAAFLCWFFRSALCSRVYKIKSDQNNVHLRSKVDLTLSNAQDKRNNDNNV